MTKRPSVSERLETVERLIERDARSEIGRDPLGLVEPQVNESLIQEREKQDMLTALANPQIRRVLYRVMNMAGILDDSSDPDPIRMAHHNGRRFLGLLLYKAIKEVSPGAYFQMEREADSDSKSQKEKNENAD